MSHAAVLLFLLLLAALAALALRVYGRQFSRLITEGGNVHVLEFQTVDLAVALALSSWFGWIIYTSVGQASRPVGRDEMIRGGTVFLLIIFFLLGFLQIRGRDLPKTFGLARLSPLRALWSAFGFLCAALPLIYVAGLASMLSRQTTDQPQEIVTFFVERVRESDFSAVFETLLFGTVLAPIAEEVIFRGYLYGAFKRFAGPGFALALNAGLFAAIHLNAASFAGLFVLACCLIIAYEATGSLLVPVFMHSMFNLGNLLLLFLHSRTVAPHG